MKSKIFSEILSEVTPEIESKVEQKANQILAMKVKLRKCKFCEVPFKPTYSTVQ